MWKLALLCIFAAPALADAPAFRARAACDTTGPALVEVDRIKDVTPPEKQVTTIFESGGWSAADPGAKRETGCVPDADFKQLRADLAKAAWKITKARFKCDAMSLVRTEYRVHGKLVWTAKLCSGESLDQDSAAAIAAIDALATKLDPARRPIN